MLPTVSAPFSDPTSLKPISPTRSHIPARKTKNLAREQKRETRLRRTAWGYGKIKGRRRRNRPLHRTALGHQSAMSLRPQPPHSIPEETQRVAHTAFDLPVTPWDNGR